MPNLTAPPTYIKDLSDPAWKRWFSLLHQTVEGIDSTSSGGDAGISLPSGGTTGQILAKASDGEDYLWIDAPIGIPEGGENNSVLTKTDDASYAVDWVLPTTVFSGFSIIDGGDAPVSDPFVYFLNGGAANSTYTDIVNGGAA